MNDLDLRQALRLMLVGDDHLSSSEEFAERAVAAVQGGVTSVQVRCKATGDAEVLRLTRELVGRLAVPVFVNDRLDLTLAAGAAGVHLGADDLSPAAARRIVPTGFVIGASVGDRDEASRGDAADYWGIGPVNGSSTKADAGSALGIDGARSLLGLASGRPAVAIGRVSVDDVPGLIAAGFGGVAVASGILSAADPAVAAVRYRAAIDSTG